MTDPLPGYSANEIFARHGYAFANVALREYFARQRWYASTKKNVGTNAAPFGATLFLPDSTVTIDGKAVVEKGELKVVAK